MKKYYITTFLCLIVSWTSTAQTGIHCSTGKADPTNRPVKNSITKAKDAVKSNKATAQAYIKNFLVAANNSKPPLDVAVSYTINPGYWNQIKKDLNGTSPYAIRIYNAIDVQSQLYYVLYPLKLDDPQSQNSTTSPIDNAPFYWQDNFCCCYKCSTDKPACVFEANAVSPLHNTGNDADIFREDVLQYYLSVWPYAPRSNGPQPFRITSFVFTANDYNAIVPTPNTNGVALRLFMGLTDMNAPVLVLVGADKNGAVNWDGPVYVSSTDDGHLCPYECDLF